MFEHAARLERLNVADNLIATKLSYRADSTAVDTDGAAVLPPASITAPRTEDLRALAALRALVASSSSLVELNLSNCGLTAHTLAEMLSPPHCWASSSLKSLLLSGNKLTAGRGGRSTVHEEGIAALTGFLCTCTENVGLTELDVSNTGLTAAQLQNLGEALAGKETCLQVLSLSLSLSDWLLLALTGSDSLTL